MKLILTLMFILKLGSTLNAQSLSSALYFPAEREGQKSIWIWWSVDPTIQQVHVEMTKALAPHFTLTILSRSNSVQNSALHQLTAAGIDTAKTKRYIHNIPNIMIKDFGPKLLKDKKGELDNTLAEEMNLNTDSKLSLKYALRF